MGIVTPIRLKILPVTAAIFLAGSVSCGADPRGGTVVGGSAVIQNSSNNVTVTQTSPSAIINWNTFNIGAGETTQFNQPSSTSVVLNRVTGGLGPSEIYGTLLANGNVFLVNPFGVLVGPTGVINTAGFLATTADIKNSDFMAGRYNFGMPGRSDASIVNQGRITATSGGFAALVAPGVRNSGTITATLGSVSLAAGNTFTLDLYGDKLIQLAPGDAIADKVIDVATGKPLSALLGNEGTIKADGGRIELTAAAARQVVDAVINNTGVLEADTVGTRAGKIVLGAATASNKPAGAPTQTVKLSGTVSAAGRSNGSTGGTIVVTGENIAVSGARIDASGQAGGGKVLIGGDWGGGKPVAIVNNQSARLESYAIPTATTLSVDAGTVIDASAKSGGNGGKVILWSDAATTFAGTIFAQGGSASGNGGFVETSGKGQLNFSGQVSTLAPNGAAGTLLLDPADYYIVSGSTSVPTGASSITNTTLQSQLANGNVVIATNNSANPAGQSGDIFVNAPVSWSSGSTLTLNAFHGININAPITIAGSGGLILSAATDPVLTSLPLLSFASGGNVQFTGTPNSGQSLMINGQSYTLLYSASDLQNIINTDSGLTGSYALAKSIALTSWTPLGSIASPLTGTFEGLGNTISGASISATGPIDNNIGLFAAIGAGGVVRDLILSNFTVTANPNVTLSSQFIGTLAGSNFGTISNVTATGGSVNGGALQGVIAGGLVGQNGAFMFSAASNALLQTADTSFSSTLVQTPGTISGSQATVAVSVGDGCSGQNCMSGGFNAAGGLVGSNTAGSTIINSSAGGNVAGGSNSAIGGFVGQNGLLVFQGGLDTNVPTTVTIAAGTITGSSASGAVNSTGTNVSLGGFAGTNAFGSTINTSHAGGNVTDTATASGSRGNCNSDCQDVTVGGFVGQNEGTIGTIPTSVAAITSPALTQTCTTGFNCATGAVTVGAGGQGGGFAGSNHGAIGFAFATGPVIGGDNSNVGGFAGNNNRADSGNTGCTGTCAPGIIAGAWASGPVTAGAGALAGGFSASNEGIITTATATTGTVSAGGNSIIGGLVGGMGPGGYVTLSKSTEAATSTGPNSMVGGLIGGSFGLVTLSSASGPVNSTANSYLGGLIGFNAGAIVQSYATGPVTGTGAANFAGGLTGLNTAWGPLPDSGAYNFGTFAYTGPTVATGTILQSYAIGAVSSGATSYVGGLSGGSLATQLTPTTNALITTDSTITAFAPSITQSYATGSANGGATSFVAGLVAINNGAINQTYATGKVNGGSGATLGGLLASNALNSTSSILPAFPSPLLSCTECGVFLQTALTTGTGTVANSYWDTQATTQAASAAGSGLTSAQLTSGLPLGYDASIWSINTGTSYPYLLNPKQSPPPAPASLDPPLPPTQTASQNQVVQQFTATVTTPNTNEVVNTQTVTQSQTQQQPSQGQGQALAQSPPPGGKIPGQLDVGPGRFFYIPPPGETKFISNKLLVQIDSSVPLSELQRIASLLGLTIVASENLGLVGQTAYEFQINNGEPVAAIIPKMAEFQSLTHVAPVYQFFLTQDAAREGDPGQYVLEKLNLTGVHRAVRGSNVEVAVIDSEIDVSHPDLAGVILDHYDATGVDEIPHPHGTGMAGAIASHRRLMGIAPNARLLAIKAFSTKSATAESTTLNILKGLDHAVANGVRIINMSFAGPRDPSIERAIKAAYDRGVIMIAAAGNAGPKSPPLYPAADPNVIAVTATDIDDKLFPGANRGRYIAIAAPGVDIMVPAPAGAYQLTTGTSVATAHVSGVVALMLERNPALTPADVRRILASSARRLGPNDQFGAGLVDPAKAVALAAPRSVALPAITR
jgi:filamentous hemagglutinin family protein